MLQLITAVILTKNEELNIEKCLKSVSWCDEVIIVDDESSDKTIKIARRYKAIVYTNALGGDFSSQRNFGLSKVKNDWVLFLDADERVSKLLQEEIKDKIKNFSSISGYRLRRLDYLWGRELKHGETGNIKLLRLAKKQAGKWEGAVHEEWKIRGKIGELQNPILHYPHQSISEFLKEINFYTDIRSEELFEKGINVNVLSVIVYPKMKFIQNFFLRLGFLDGIPGLIFAIIMSMHSFLVRGKLWLKNNS